MTDEDDSNQRNQISGLMSFMWAKNHQSQYHWYKPKRQLSVNLGVTSLIR
jgi:hypothetical protein